MMIFYLPLSSQVFGQVNIITSTISLSPSPSLSLQPRTPPPPRPPADPRPPAPSPNKAHAILSEQATYQNKQPIKTSPAKQAREATFFFLLLLELIYPLLRISTHARGNAMQWSAFHGLRLATSREQIIHSKACALSRVCFLKGLVLCCAYSTALGTGCQRRR